MPCPLPDFLQRADVPTLDGFFTTLAANMKAGVIKPSALD